MIEDLTEQKLEELTQKAKEVRKLVLESIFEAQSGHPAGSLGMTDVFTALYFHILNHNPKDPNWIDRDRLMLSNGHICPVQYSCLALSGYFSTSELKTLRKINSRLQGHPHRIQLPGIETTSGPLGEGLSQAIGFALAARLNKKKYHIYCVTSDGEHNEGNTWEAVMFAGKNKIDNLTEIIDRNHIQISGTTEEVMPVESLREKYEAFNWRVLEVDGNNMVEIIESARRAKTLTGKPVVIIAENIPGKGVSFMEKNCKWHGKAPSKDEFNEAIKEIDNA